jgi:spore cortex formation protein SpoVR/YcgB (stage V sporulation)
MKRNLYGAEKSKRDSEIYAIYESTQKEKFKNIRPKIAAKYNLSTKSIIAIVNYKQNKP